jgi:hypothetical protein
LESIDMKKFVGISFIAMCSASTLAVAEQIDDAKINWLRTHSTKHGTVPGITSFKVDKALSSGCAELVIPANDNLSMSHVLAAKAGGNVVDVIYTSQQGPWPSGCWAIAVTSK